MSHEQHIEKPTMITPSNPELTEVFSVSQTSAVLRAEGYKL